MKKHTIYYLLAGWTGISLGFAGVSIATNPIKFIALFLPTLILSNMLLHKKD